MKRARRGRIALALGLSLLGATGANAQDDFHERLFEITPLVGTFIPDDNIRYTSASPMIGVRAALNNSTRWGLEGMLAIAPGQKQVVREGMLNSYRAQPVFDQQGRPTGNFVITEMEVEERTVEHDSNLLLFGGSAIVNLKLRERSFLLLSLGGGFIDDISNSDESPPAPFSNLFADIGVGFKFFRKNGWGLRVEAHDYVMRRDDLPRANPRAAVLAAIRDVQSFGGTDRQLGREPYDPFEYRGKRWLNNYAVTVSVSFPFGYAWKDGDGDLVEDRFDECLTTAPGVVVNGAGCGIDTDSDGVFDGLDRCADTPIGAIVDIGGCPSDADEDGVLDGLDVADDTPKGALVDARGQHFDTDQDGIWDGLDDCNDTPLGASIDEMGCADDPLEERLLRGETILVDNIEFEGGTDDLEPLSFHYVNKISRLLERWTGNDEQPLKIEVGVHTDGVGSESYNLELSQRRAEVIRNYMLENFFGMGENNLVAIGYGESAPLGDDGTEEGRGANRRVEVRMLGPGEEPVQFGVGDEDLEGLDELGLDEEVPPVDLEAIEMPEEIERPEIDLD